ncbi:MAG: molybdopterin-dependent oxidoreductase [Bacteroidia bacterium]|nr:molybdopterin-dependent oxidoreductase [Bacteroidia bacterium]
MSQAENNNEKTKKSFSRRKFLVRASIGAGVLVGLPIIGINPLRRSLFENLESMLPEYAITDPATTWFEVTADNKIFFHSPKVEMGQGAFTGLAQIAAEELEVDIEKINMLHATTAGRPIDPRSTGGSDSISALFAPLRELAAGLREMIKNNAAEILGVSAASLKLANGVISANGKSITYGEVVQQANKWEAPKEVRVKARKDFKVIGKPIPRVDLMPKILGEPIFSIDQELPGMLYAMVIRPPKIDTQYKIADASKAELMPGIVKVVKEKDFVAVVGKSRPEVEMAIRAVKVDWETNKNWNQEEILEMTKVGKGEDQLIQKQGSKIKEEGLIEFEYTTPAGAHAQLEPNGSVAHVTADKAILYISTQVPGITRKEVAEALGFEEEQVEVQPTYLGGGFGRKLHTPNSVQAALISKAVGKAVHVFYSRKDEFQTQKFRPPSHHVLKAKLNDKGMIDYIEHHVSAGNASFGSPISSKGLEMFMGADLGIWSGGRINYTKIPNIRFYSWHVELPFATTMWRAPGVMANTFAVESFMDELAHAAGKDPLEFRLVHLPDNEKGQRQKAVLKAAAEKAGWGKNLPEGRVLGIATSGELATVIAEVAEVSIENDGYGDYIKVHKVTCAIDAGMIINPDGVKAQVEGGVMMGLSASMYEKIEINDSRVQPTIYGPYRIAMMKDAPKEIEVIIIESGDKPLGVGEPPIGPIGAAIGNAVFSLTGKRLRKLPLAEEFAKVSS